MRRASILTWLLLLLTHVALAGDSYLPTTGPIQTWNLEVSALVREAHLWYLASLGPFETCEGQNRWLGVAETVARPDGQRCAYYTLYWSQRRRLWVLYHALPSLVSCGWLDAMAFLVPDAEHPLSCEQLERDFGELTGR